MKIVPVQPIGVEIFWDKIKPLINKDISANQAQFIVGSEEALLSRLKNN